MKSEDQKLDELLGQGLLGGPTYDKILERVLARPEVRGRRPIGYRKKWMALFGAAAALGAAGWLLVARSPVDTVTPKGGPERVGGGLDIGCGPTGSRICHPGDTLMFTVNSALVSGYVSAYADRADIQRGERIWYFPTSAGLSPQVRYGQGTVVVPQGIEVGSEHHPGTYLVTVQISEQPILRGAADAGNAPTIRARSTFTMEVRP